MFISLAGFQVAASELNFSGAQKLACEEAARVNFTFETTCEEELSDANYYRGQYEFSAVDLGGNCGIFIFVDAMTGAATSEMNCE